METSLGLKQSLFLLRDRDRQRVIMRVMFPRLRRCSRSLAIIMLARVFFSLGYLQTERRDC